MVDLTGRDTIKYQPDPSIDGGNTDKEVEAEDNKHP